MRRIQEVMSDMKYQHPVGASTFGPCSSEHCVGTARGSRTCASCLEYELAQLTDDVFAATFRRLVCELCKMEDEALERGCGDEMDT